MFIYSIYKAIYRFCDKLEDHVRGYFSHYPIIYALIGGIGIVLFWRGVWHTVDFIMFKISTRSMELTSIDLNYGLWWDGPLSLLAGAIILLMTGVFVSNFIGNEILISGLKGDKKIAEKTEKELREEESELMRIKNEVDETLARLKALQEKLEKIKS